MGPDELGTNESAPGFRVSSYCGNGGCIAVRLADTVRVRDSNQAAGGPELEFTPDEWRAFVAGVKAGEFDL